MIVNGIYICPRNMALATEYFNDAKRFVKAKRSERALIRLRGALHLRELAKLQICYLPLQTLRNTTNNFVSSNLDG